MSTREHLIIKLQEQYAFLRDYLPQLDAVIHQAANGRLRVLLRKQHDEMRAIVEALDRTLSLLGARYTLEHHPVAQAQKEATERFRHRLNPSREQLDMHVAIEALAVEQLLLGHTQGEAEMARAVGEPDVAKVLDETIQRQQTIITALHDCLPALIGEISRTEARRAA